MSRLPALLRRATVLVAAVLLGVVAAPTAALAHHPQPEPQRFYADSGDFCPYGLTEGTLVWQYVHAPEVPGVEVRGVVVDRPVGSELACRDDGYYSIANFVAYSGDRPVDKASERADNTRHDFYFTLSYWGAIDRVEIQVCRHVLAGHQFYCGPKRVYSP